jgi:hypothetical protein
MGNLEDVLAPQGAKMLASYKGKAERVQRVLNVIM